MYSLKYLPIAQKDLKGIVNYITEKLKSPKAALDFVDMLDNSISRLKEFPYSCRVYQSKDTFEEEYRVLVVRNYLVFYVVLDDVVEIRRIIYARMDIKNIVKYLNNRK